MTRYIDAEKLEEGIFPEVTNWYQEGWNDALKGAMLAIPTADFVPRKEVEALLKENDRWMTEYAGFRAGVKSIVENVKQELVREIFEEMEKNTRFTINLVEAMEFDSEEIRKAKLECYRDCLGYYGKLKKRYTEEKT